MGEKLNFMTWSSKYLVYMINTNTQYPTVFRVHCALGKLISRVIGWALESFFGP